MKTFSFKGTVSIKWSENVTKGSPETLLTRTMNDFSEFLHRKAELKTKYDFVLNSCKIFANVTLQMKSYFKVM
ncbi:hypothetical protein pdam_00021732 [Pocillopora damicornis]|uniref:Uncharacterized protein n=1 Tax=Pocillopora damicornis TaxID=46731 RepID=A0A3M6TMA7_POCDA|nr:hypothetical protein pdam_00021732 [Pocillopora damicornis]